MPRQPKRIPIYRDIDMPPGLDIDGWFELDEIDVVDFVVRLDGHIDGQWHGIKQYDCAHNRPHWDLLGWDGATVAWDWTLSTNHKDALIEAIHDLTENADVYQDVFLMRKPR